MDSQTARTTLASPRRGQDWQPAATHHPSPAPPVPEGGGSGALRWAIGGLLSLLVVGAGACVAAGVMEVRSEDTILMSSGLGEVLLALGLYFLLPCVGVAMVLATTLLRSRVSSLLRWVRPKLAWWLQPPVSTTCLVACQQTLCLDTALFALVHHNSAMYAAAALVPLLLAVGMCVFAHRTLAYTVVAAWGALGTPLKLGLLIFTAEAKTAETSLVVAVTAVLQYFLCIDCARGAVAYWTLTMDSTTPFALMTPPNLISLLAISDITYLLGSAHGSREGVSSCHCLHVVAVVLCLALFGAVPVLLALGLRTASLRRLRQDEGARDGASSSLLLGGEESATNYGASTHLGDAPVDVVVAECVLDTLCWGVDVPVLALRMALLTCGGAGPADCVFAVKNILSILLSACSLPSLPLSSPPPPPPPPFALTA